MANYKSSLNSQCFRIAFTKTIYTLLFFILIFSKNVCSEENQLKDKNKDLELAAEDLRMATRHLGSIVGKVDVEEILGSIVKDFCIGK